MSKSNVKTYQLQDSATNDQLFDPLYVYTEYQDIREHGVGIPCVMARFKPTTCPVCDDTTFVANSIKRHLKQRQHLARRAAVARCNCHFWDSDDELELTTRVILSFSRDYGVLGLHGHETSEEEQSSVDEDNED